MATINSISGSASSGYTAPITPTQRLESVSAGTPGVDQPLPFPTDPIDLNADGSVTQGEIAQSLRPQELVQPAPEQPALSTTTFAELAAPQEDASAQEAEAARAQEQQPVEQAAAQRTAAGEEVAAPEPARVPEQSAPTPPAVRAPAQGFVPSTTTTTTTATSATTATTNGSAIADAESAVTSLLGEIASRSYGAVQSAGRGQPALSLVA